MADILNRARVFAELMNREASYLREAEEHLREATQACRGANDAGLEREAEALLQKVMAKHASLNQRRQKAAQDADRIDRELGAQAAEFRS